MDKVSFGMQMQDLMESAPVDVVRGLALVGEFLPVDAKGATKGFAMLTEAVVKGKDLRGAVACVAFYADHGAQMPEVTLAQLREVVSRAPANADEKLLIDSIGLNTAIATAIAKRLGVLLALKPGVYVTSQSWGFGQVQAIDTFYGKVIIDFEGKKGHAMSLTVAGQNLEVAREGHLMTRLTENRAEIEDLCKKHPAALVRLTLESYGPLTVQRLAERLASCGLVSEKAWKSFWEAARRGLKADKEHPVEIPTKRTEPIRLLEADEDFGEKWLKRFAKERDLKAIYEGILGLLVAKKDAIPDSYIAVVKNRLDFAIKGSEKSDFPRYAQLVCLAQKLQLSSAEEQLKQAETLLEKDEEDNLLLAVKGLAARDVSAMVSFILAAKPEAKAVILAHLEAFGGVALGATLSTLAGDAETGEALRALLTQRPRPLPTVVVWALRNRNEAEAWQLPKINDLITQSIHIIEQHWTGEELRMRNALQGFFDSAKWLEEVCKELNTFQREVMFERIQASTVWDTASQRNILIRLVRFDPELGKLRRATKALEEHPHLTSERSLTAFKLAYDHLINVEIPANTRDIATARSYGDLRENAEYQFAKDHQRVLLSKQDEMDRTLKLLKTTDFSGVGTEVAAMGTRVTVETKHGTQCFTILGELDRDEALNIISCRSRLAMALIGQRVGATVELPDERGLTAATIKAIEPLDEATRAWLAQIPTAYEPNA